MRTCRVDTLDNILQLFLIMSSLSLLSKSWDILSPSVFKQVFKWPRRCRRELSLIASPLSSRVADTDVLWKGGAIKGQAGNDSWHSASVEATMKTFILLVLALAAASNAANDGNLGYVVHSML